MSRANKHVSRYMNALINKLPSEQKKKVLIDRKIKQTHEQFAACVNDFILEHVNSVYLIKEPVDDQPNKNDSTDVSRETQLVLTVYVDNSMVAAELNAQRELIMLKYRELFNVEIAQFLIKISRGSYLNNYPFRKDKQTAAVKNFHPLSKSEEEEIKQATAHITDKEIRESFQRALKATKEHPLKN